MPTRKQIWLVKRILYVHFLSLLSLYLKRRLLEILNIIYFCFLFHLGFIWNRDKRMNLTIWLIKSFSNCDFYLSLIRWVEFKHTPSVDQIILLYLRVGVNNYVLVDFGFNILLVLKSNLIELGTILDNLEIFISFWCFCKQCKILIFFCVQIVCSLLLINRIKFNEGLVHNELCHRS